MSSEALLNSSLPHDLVMGGISRGGSQHYLNVCFLLSNLLQLYSGSENRVKGLDLIECLKNYGQRSLVGYSLWGRKESDMME